MAKNDLIASEILKELEMQRQYRTDLVASSKRVEELRKSIKDSYPNFIDECLKTNQGKFVDIKKFPTTEEIRSFYQYGSPKITDDILMYEYGWFDIKELVVIIKLLYSLKKQKEYRILTLATIDVEYKGLEVSDMEFVSYMNFLIGPDKRVKYLDKCNGKYYDKYFLEGNILDEFNANRHQNFVRLKQKGKRERDNSLGINFEGDDCVKNYLQYNDGSSHWPRYACFSSDYNIFDSYFGEVIRKLDKEPRSKVCSLLSFSLDLQDAFIARVLFSIVVYKKKINKFILTNDDYKYIFYELFREDVDVLDVVDREIPKVLTRYK